MKKLAILIWGEYREFELASKSWTFINDIDCDVYISTWYTSYVKSELVNICEYITEDKIRSIISNININIEYDIKTHYIGKVFHHFKKLFEMVDKSGNEYEYVLLFRTDLYIKEIISLSEFIDTLEDNTIYACGEINIPPYGFYFIQDILFLSKYNLGKKIFTSLISPIEIIQHENGYYYDMHYYLACHFINNNVDICNIKYGIKKVIDCCILRYNHRGITDFSMDNIKRLFNLWE